MRKLNSKSFLMLILIASLIAGLIGSTTFPGYIKGAFVIPVVMTHSLIYYLLYTRPIKDILFKYNKTESKQKEFKRTKKTPAGIGLELEEMSNRDLLSREGELFNISVNEVPVPRTITQQLKDVREEMRDRGFTL